MPDGLKALRHFFSVAVALWRRHRASSRRDPPTLRTAKRLQKRNGRSNALSLLAFDLRHSTFGIPKGGIAQLVERQLCKLDVRGSNPLASISKRNGGGDENAVRLVGLVTRKGYNPAAAGSLSRAKAQLWIIPLPPIFARSDSAKRRLSRRSFSEGGRL